MRILLVPLVTLTYVILIIIQRLVVKNRHIARIIALSLLVLVMKAVVLSPFPVKNAGFAAISEEAVHPNKIHPPFHQVIKDYASDYGIDYRLVYALIKQESRFNPNATSEMGASGLMQVMPAADIDSADNNEVDLSVPEENIKAGVSYLSQMMHLFDGCSYEDQVQLALAAYNAGPGRVYDAQELAAYIGENPKNWPSVKNALPLLSKRCYSLHKAVWRDGKPKNGTFGEWRQTIHYVENVMGYYSAYRQQYR